MEVNRKWTRFHKKKKQFVRRESTSTEWVIDVNSCIGFTQKLSQFFSFSSLHFSSSFFCVSFYIPSLCPLNYWLPAKNSGRWGDPTEDVWSCRGFCRKALHHKVRKNKCLPADCSQRSKRTLTSPYSLCRRQQNENNFFVTVHGWPNFIFTFWKESSEAFPLGC